MLNNILTNNFEVLLVLLGLCIFIASKSDLASNLCTWLRFTVRLVFGYKRLSGIHVQNVDGGKFRYLMILGSMTLLPDNVLNLMKKQEVAIFYGKNREHFNSGNFAGFFHSEENIIFIWDDGLDGNWGWQVTTTLHEIGHFVDYTVGYNRFLSLTDTRLHNIYVGEHKYYKRYTNGNYYTDNIREYFAQGFAEYYLVKGFQHECPDTALYIEGILLTV